MGRIRSKMRSDDKHVYFHPDKTTVMGLIFQPVSIISIRSKNSKNLSLIVHLPSQALVYVSFIIDLTLTNNNSVG